MLPSEQITSVFRQAGIQLPSLMSLRLRMSCKNQATDGDLELAQGTGFLFDWQGRPYLVTNRHNLSGRRQDTDEPLNRSCAVPDTVHIAHNLLPKSGPESGKYEFGWELTPEPLIDGTTGLNRWYEHPTWESQVDVVVLPLTQVPADVVMLPYTSHGFSRSIGVGPSQDLSIIGFPFGESSGGNVAVWVRGAIATEPIFNYEGLPRFLIDARTRPGQSGSPVVIYSASGITSDAQGITLGSSGPYQRLVGVYSGRTSDQSDLGYVWKTSTIAEILSAADVSALPPLEGLEDFGGDVTASDD